ncbi:MAG: right-handed parallel beta-helix repeat-containing protein [Candidatus Delongbacteria bacterium]|nr:right-handed parallel beta-helix repeat-containing protein [Candidatus Delongbacteria bacterium]
MKKINFGLMVWLIGWGMLWGMVSQAADLYVSKTGGDNQNDGSIKAPFKNIESALKTAQPGDRIHVAQGNYVGLRDKGYFEAPQPVELLGGYSLDFAERNVIKYPTTVIPSRESGASGRRPLLSILNVPEGSVFILDGFIFDRGEQNAYSPKESVIAGLGGRILSPTEKPADGPSTVDEPLICFTNKVNAKVLGNLIIRNCVFLNGHFAIQGGFKTGTVSILNNIFLGNKMAAIEVFGLGGKKGPKGPIEKSGHVEIAHNTILFTWSRLKDFADMGYGIRVMTMVSYDIHDNLIGCNILTGIDHTRGNLNEWVKIDHNLIFLNKQAPLLYVEPGRSAAGKMERVKIGDMNADLGLASCKGNTDLLNTKLPLHKAYFENFLNARYNETEDYDPNSPANVLREVMGLNKQGKLITKVTMYANRYPMADALKLFGAYAKTGAQMPQ